MRLCIPETMRTHLCAIFIIILLLFHSNAINAVDTISPSQKVDSEIKTISIVPSLPLVNEAIKVNAVISLNNAEDFNNLTITYTINDVTTQVLMNEISPNKYETVIPGQPTATSIFIDVILYTDNTQVDIYSTSIPVLSHPSDRALIQIPMNRPVGLNRGNYSLFTKNKTLEVNTTVLKPVGFIIRERKHFNFSKPHDFTFVSDIYDIEFNQSQNIVDSTVAIRFNNSLIQKLGSILQGVKLMTRANDTTDWAPVNTTIFVRDGMISASVDHFSQWALAVADARIQILPQSSYLQSDVNKELNLSFEIKNIGNIIAENITIELFGPTQLLILPQEENYSNSLTPLETINASWIVYPEREAEFNLILRVKGSDGLISSQLVKIDTTSKQNSSVDVHSTTSATPFQLIIISIITSFIIIVRLRKYIR